MIYLLLIAQLWAHEDLESTRCVLEKQVIEITKLKEDTYKIKTPDMKQAEVFKKPDPEDIYDPKAQQIFDTYTFRKGQKTIVQVKRPETKGPVKSKIAVWQGKNFTCR
jgi:hypothetical protein